MAALRALILLLGLMSVHGFMSNLSESSIPPMKIEHKYENNNCKSYMCTPVNHTLAPGVCVYDNSACWSNAVWYLTPCNDFVEPSYCDLSQMGCNHWQSSCTETPGVKSQAFPGEKCATNSTCNTNLCDATTELCVGAAAGSFCLDSSYCGQGLYCSANLCVPQLDEGGICTADYQCQNTLGCNTNNRAPGTCVPYISIAKGKAVANCGNNSPYQSSLCITGSCYLTEPYYNNGNGVCMDPIISLNPTPQICNSNSDCVGSADGDQFVGTCYCGVNPKSDAYCTAFLGDNAGHDLLFYYNSILQGNLSAQCNTLHRFDPQCFKSLPVTWGHTAAKAVIYYQHYPYLQNNDQCIQKMITNYYWYFDAAAQFLTFSALLVVAS